MVERGVAYDIEGGSPGLTVVPLTKNAWNRAMHGVGCVPLIVDLDSPSPHAVSLGEQVADVTRFIVVPQERFGKPVATLADHVLARLERALSDLLDLDRLCADPPRGVRPPAGVLDYPRWGEVYYVAGQRVENENKRFIVVSNDRWNQLKRSVLVVRLTSQPKHSTDEFPGVGGSQACCGELMAVLAGNVELSRRPSGTTRLTMGEMSAIARGITSTHVLRDFLTLEEIYESQ